MAESRSFAVAGSGSLCIEVTAGPEGMPSAATIWLDDVEIVGPAAFNPHVERIQRVVPIEGGEHEVRVRVASRPGSSLVIQFRFVPAPPPEVLAEGGRGRMRLVGIGAVPSPFTPNGDGRTDSTMLRADVEVLALPGAPSDRFAYSLETHFTIVAPATCEPVRQLDVIAPVPAVGMMTPAVVWDGRDGTGTVVQDGIYLFSVSTVLVRMHGATRTVLDTLESGFRSVIVDTTAPIIMVSEPAVEPDGVATLEAFQGPDLHLHGRLTDISAIERLEVTLNGTPLAATLQPDGSFSATGTLVIPTNEAYSVNDLRIVAVDIAELESALRVEVRLLAAAIRGRILVRFAAEAAAWRVDEVIRNIGASVIRLFSPTRQYLLAVDPAVDPAELAARVTEMADVAWALPLVPGRDDGFCDADPLRVDDPLRNHPQQWYLNNEPTYAIITKDARRCEPGVPADCTTDMLGRIASQCFLGICGIRVPGLREGDFRWVEAFTDRVCGSDADCFALPGGTDGTCLAGGGRCRNAGLLRDVVCATDVDCTAASLTGPCVVSTGFCGKTGARGADIGWSDPSAQVCGIQATGRDVVLALVETGGIADMRHPDLQTRVWVNEDECCLDPPCVDGPADADLLPDCGQGDLNRDGCPGVCGADDDLDGYADWADPDVRHLVQRICCNTWNEDVDGVGAANDGCGVLPAGITLPPGCPLPPPAVGTPEWLVAAQDDDENGYIDDVHGYDFVAAAFGGERAGSTHRDWPFAATSHMTGTAGVVGAALDNGRFLAGIHPRVRIMLVRTGAASVDDPLVPALRYAAANGARIVNMSFGYPHMCAAPCTGADAVAYHALIASWDRMFADARDPSVLYVFSAGNDRIDMTTVAGPPDATGWCAGGSCLWRFPQDLGTYPDLAGTGPLGTLVVASTNIGDELADYFLWSGRLGTNIGTVRAAGGSAVDIGAPGDAFGLLDVGDTVKRSGATSHAAPVVSAVAAMLMSRPDTDAFYGHPDLVAQHIVDTRQSCQPSPDPLIRPCTGNMLHEGRVDLRNAMATAPPPTAGLWLNENFRLHGASLVKTNTHDVKFVDLDLDGRADHLLELSGSLTGESFLPRLYRYDALGREFREVSGAALPSDPSIPGSPNPGNFQEAAVGDFNGDGCADMVWAGYLEPDPSPITPVYPVRGTADRLLFQVKSGASCTYRFTDVTAAKYPVQGDMTVDVDVLDVNGDFRPDLYVTNGRYPLIHGADFNDRLLVNVACGDSTYGCFEDQSLWRLPGIPPSDPHNTSVVCDVDGRNGPDVVTATFSGPNRLLINNGAGIFSDESAARLPADPPCDLSHDVGCADWTGPGGVGGPDGYPEIFFARRGAAKEIFLANEGRPPLGRPGYFTDASILLPDVYDTTSAMAVCDLERDSIPEVILGNGCITGMLAESNRVLRWDGGRFRDADGALGFRFTGSSGVAADVLEGGVTEDIDCGDFDGDRYPDAVAIGNGASEPTWLYFRQP